MIVKKDDFTLKTAAELIMNAEKWMRKFKGVILTTFILYNDSN